MAFICGDQAIHRSSSLRAERKSSEYWTKGPLKSSDSVNRIALIIGGCAIGLVIIVGVTVGVALRKKKRVEPRFSTTYLDDGESVYMRAWVVKKVISKM